MSKVKKICEVLSFAPASGVAFPKQRVFFDTSCIPLTDVMKLYDRDPTCKSSVDLLAASTVGMGFYTTADEKYEKTSEAKAAVDKFCEDVNLDGLLNEMAKPLLKQAPRLLASCEKRISRVIADRQYYSAEVFAAVRRLGAEPVIPYPFNVKDPLIDLWLTKRFKVKGDPRLVKLYRLRMAVERSFKAGKLELMMENLRWRGVVKVWMHVAICFACMYVVAITAHKIGRLELANSIAAFTY